MPSRTASSQLVTGPPDFGVAAKRVRRVQRVGEDMEERGRRIRLGRAPGEFQRVLHDLLDLRVDGVDLAGRGRLEILDELLAERRDGIALSPLVDLGLRPIGAGDVVALVMADGAVGLGLDQRRAVAAPGAMHRVAHRLVHGQHVVAVDGDAGNAVGGGAGRDLGVERRRSSAASRSRRDCSRR